MTIYQVQYYYVKSMFDLEVIEDQLFSTLSQAQKAVLAIVEEEEFESSRPDFMDHKIKIVQRKIDDVGDDSDIERELYYDMQGECIYDSNTEAQHTKEFTRMYALGDIVEITPFPWSVDSYYEKKMVGVVASYFADDEEGEQYIVYGIDDFRVIHVHAFESSLRGCTLSSLGEQKEWIGFIQKKLSDYHGRVSDEDFVFEHTLRLAFDEEG